MNQAAVFTELFCFFHVYRLNSAQNVPKNAYCEFGLCAEDVEYCCAENTCCQTKTDLWLLWLGLAVFLLGLLVVCGFGYHKRKSYSKYTRVNTQIDLR